MSDAVIKHQEQVIKALVWRCCLNCEHFSTETEVVPAADGASVTRTKRQGCSIAGNVLPPAAVLVVGCTAWRSEVPF